MRVLVTGAGSGVGRATATLLASRGHEVVATARDRACLDDIDVAARLHLDVTDAASVDEVRRELGWVDALVNNAAISFHGPIEQVALEHVRQMFETNVLGPVRLMQAFVPGMRSRRGRRRRQHLLGGRARRPTPERLLRRHQARPGGHLRGALRRAGTFRGTCRRRRARLHRAGHEGPRCATGGLGVYDELDAQLGEVARKMQAGARPGPELVATAVADAIDSDTGPLRRRVGDDANLILSARSTLGDEEFEKAMRAVVGLSW